MTQTHAVIGTGVTGRSVVRHLLANGMECVGFDTRPVQPSAVELEPIDVHWQIEHWSTQKIEQHLAGVSRVVVSPGVPLNLRILQVAEELGLPIVSDIDLFFEATNAPVLGVTGTNGKSTVVSLVGHLLNGVGESCGVGGNIGHAALDLLTRPQSRYVLELSSFQLERSALLPFAASTVLNVSDDHIDHHGSLQSYQQAKLRIYGNAGCRIFNRQDTATKPD
ncbi:MAG: UDP-N-acetylmuramoyl-L-alanine--D-glutamate ligase, partial [Proteobacteria bacterium]|nr:UDP-N-acetylmuramoyl-L-alanine--D-glutamate ligase [Pseudomonadota bacterium]